MIFLQKAFLNYEDYFIVILIPLKFVPNSPTNNQSTV